MVLEEAPPLDLEQHTLDLVRLGEPATDREKAGDSAGGGPRAANLRKSSEVFLPPSDVKRRGSAHPSSR